MRKLQIEDAEVMRIAIQQEIGRSEESRYDHRLHGLLLVTAGHSCREVAELFGENGTTVQRWVSRFEQSILRNSVQKYPYSMRSMFQVLTQRGKRHLRNLA